MDNTEDTETPEIEISKKTGKPKRQISEQQKEILRQARENWNAKRREMKAQKALTVNPQKERFEKDKQIVETELNKLKSEVENKLKTDFETKLKMIKEEYELKMSDYEAKLNEKSSKEELKAKFMKKPKKVVEYYTTETETDMEEIKRPPIARPRPTVPSPSNFFNDNPFNRF